jgi:hypothetical protein
MQGSASISSPAACAHSPTSRHCSSGSPIGPSGPRASACTCSSALRLCGRILAGTRRGRDRRQGRRHRPQRQTGRAGDVPPRRAARARRGARRRGRTDDFSQRGKFRELDNLNWGSSDLIGSGLHVGGHWIRRQGENSVLWLRNYLEFHARRRDLPPGCGRGGPGDVIMR